MIKLDIYGIFQLVKESVSFQDISNRNLAHNQERSSFQHEISVCLLNWELETYHHVVIITSTEADPQSPLTSIRPGLLTCVFMGYALSDLQHVRSSDRNKNLLDGVHDRISITQSMIIHFLNTDIAELNRKNKRYMLERHTNTQQRQRDNFVT